MRIAAVESVLAEGIKYSFDQISFKDTTVTAKVELFKNNKGTIFGRQDLNKRFEYGQLQWIGSHWKALEQLDHLHQYNLSLVKIWFQGFFRPAAEPKHESWVLSDEGWHDKGRIFDDPVASYRGYGMHTLTAAYNSDRLQTKIGNDYFQDMANILLA